MNDRFCEVYAALCKRGDIQLNSRTHGKGLFAAAINLRTNALDRHLNGKYAVSYETVGTLCSKYGISKAYMSEGIGTAFCTEPQAQPSAAPPPPSVPPSMPQPKAGTRRRSDVTEIEGFPIATVQFINLPAFAGGTVGMQEKKGEVFHIPGIKGDLVAFNVSGDSMKPTLSSGDMIFCTPVTQPSDFKEDEMHVVRIGSEVYVKRIQRVFDRSGNWTHLRLVSDNLAYPPFEVPLGEVLAACRVTRRLTGV